MAWAALEKLTSTVAAATVTAVLGAAVVTWQHARDNRIAIEAIANRVEQLDQFARRGERFTAADGRALADLLSQHLADYREHTAWGKEWVRNDQRQQLVCEERLSELEGKITKTNERLNTWINELYRRPGNGGSSWQH